MPLGSTLNNDGAESSRRTMKRASDSPIFRMRILSLHLWRSTNLYAWPSKGCITVWQGMSLGPLGSGLAHCRPRYVLLCDGTLLQGQLATRRKRYRIAGFKVGEGQTPTKEDDQDPPEHQLRLRPLMEVLPVALGFAGEAMLLCEVFRGSNLRSSSLFSLGGKPCHIVQSCLKATGFPETPEFGLSKCTYRGSLARGSWTLKLLMFDVQNPGCEGQNPSYEGPMSVWVAQIQHVRDFSKGSFNLPRHLLHCPDRPRHSMYAIYFPIHWGGLKEGTRTFQGVPNGSPSPPLRDLHWTPLEGPGIYSSPRQVVFGL